MGVIVWDYSRKHGARDRADMMLHNGQTGGFQIKLSQALFTLPIDGNVLYSGAVGNTPNSAPHPHSMDDFR